MYASERWLVGFVGTETDVCNARDAGQILALQQEDIVMVVTNGDLTIIANPDAGTIMTVRLLANEENFYNATDDDHNRQFPVEVAEDPRLLFLVYDPVTSYWFLSCGGVLHCRRCRDREECAKWEEPFNPLNPFNEEQSPYDWAAKLRRENNTELADESARQQQEEDAYRELCYQRRLADEAQAAAEEAEEDAWRAAQWRLPAPKRRLRTLWRWLTMQRVDNSNGY